MTLPVSDRTVCSTGPASSRVRMSWPNRSCAWSSIPVTAVCTVFCLVAFTFRRCETAEREFVFSGQL